MGCVVKLKQSRAETPDPVDVYVGARLRLRRNLIGLSQKRLGESAGLTFQQIQKYERGTNRMGASRLFQLARLLGVSVSYFFDEMSSGMSGDEYGMGFAEGAPTPLDGVPEGKDEVIQRRETLELIRAYYRIKDSKKRRKVLAIIKSVSE